MGIAIAGGIGLAIGLGLLIWALGERGARHAAERTAAEAEALRDKAADTANHNAARAAEMEAQAMRLADVVEQLRRRLRDVREAAAANGSISTVRKLLETEGEDEVI